MWRTFAWLSIAGAFGTLARYGLQGFVQRLHDTGFPYGTLVVNVLGCFLFGLVWALSEDSFALSGPTRFIILVGFMGAFTTFSAFAFETGHMMRNSEWALAGLNILAQNILGIVGFLVGAALGRFF